MMAATVCGNRITRPSPAASALSALVAALPIFTLLVLMGVHAQARLDGRVAGWPRPCWWRPACTACRSAAGASITYGAAFGLFPIGWVVFSAILLYRVTLESGKFEILKDSIGHLTDDPRLQALLIAFAFGAFIEGAAGSARRWRWRRRC